MNVKASFYDVFAYTIPGGVTLFIILHILKEFNIFDFFQNLKDSSFLILVAFGGLSHVIGFLITPITYFFVKSYRSKEKIHSIAYKEVINRNPNLNDFINPADWAIWLAKIKQENIEVASGIDQFLAYSLMARGVSFGLTLSFILIITYTLTEKFDTLYLIFLPLIVLFIFVSVIQAKKFRKGFYILIFETIISTKPPFTISNEPKSKLTKQA